MKHRKPQKGKKLTTPRSKDFGDFGDFNYHHLVFEPSFNGEEFCKLPNNHICPNKQNKSTLYFQ